MSWLYITVVAIGGALFALQQFAGINGVLYFSSSNFHDAGVTNSIAASALVGIANLTGNLTLVPISGFLNCLMAFCLAFSGNARLS